MVVGGAVLEDGDLFPPSIKNMLDRQRDVVHGTRRGRRGGELEGGEGEIRRGTETGRDEERERESETDMDGTRRRTVGEREKGKGRRERGGRWERKRGEKEKDCKKSERGKE